MNKNCKLYTKTLYNTKSIIVKGSVENHEI